MPRSGSGKAKPYQRKRTHYTSTPKERYTGAKPQELEFFLDRDASDYLDHEFRADRIPATLGSFNVIFHTAIWRIHRDTVWSFILPRIQDGRWVEFRYRNFRGPQPHRHLLTARMFNQLEPWERYLLVEGIFPLPRVNPMAAKDLKTPIPHYFQLAEEW